MIITYDWKPGTDELNLHNTACQPLNLNVN